MKKLQEDYQTKSQELLDLDITNRKLSKESKQNELYDELLDSQDKLAELTYQTRFAAMQAGINPVSYTHLGVSNIITFDAHDPRVQNAIPTSGFESVMPSYQIFKALLKRDKTLQIDKEHIMIVSPDEGAIDRNIFYSSVLGLDMGLFYKRRDYTRIVNGRNRCV